MKSLLTILACVAIANMLAIGGLIGWLKMTDRLNAERVQSVRKVFAHSIADEERAAATAQAEEEQAEKDRAAADKLAEPPTGAAEQIEQQRTKDESERQRLDRQRDEIEALRAALASRLAELEQREKALAAERKALDDARTSAAKSAVDKQFKDALATLEGQKPRDAKQMLKAMIDENNTAQAVDYLARMEESKRAKVMAEFVKEDAALAAGLLERVRTRGVPAQTAASPGPTNDQPTGAARPDPAGAPASR